MGESGGGFGRGKRRHHASHVKWSTLRLMREHKRQVNEARKAAKRARRAEGETP